MRELITIQVGQCGNQIGTCFWEEIAKEHAISLDKGEFTEEKEDENGDVNVRLQRSNVFWKETQQGRFVPRSIMMDLEPGVFRIISNQNL